MRLSYRQAATTRTMAARVPIVLRTSVNPPGWSIEDGWMSSSATAVAAENPVLRHSTGLSDRWAAWAKGMAVNSPKLRITTTKYHRRPRAG